MNIIGKDNELAELVASLTLHWDFPAPSMSSHSLRKRALETKRVLMLETAGMVYTMIQMEKRTARILVVLKLLFVMEILDNTG